MTANNLNLSLKQDIDYHCNGAIITLAIVCFKYNLKQITILKSDVKKKIFKFLITENSFKLQK